MLRLRTLSQSSIEIDDSMSIGDRVWRVVLLTIGQIDLLGML
jgi:hypothetical protein